ncbi:hypothetical protein ACFXG4_20195 [Nocardia sp. NPDC059246]|uniref:AbiTii domain-containing protein n=1 Tax=unclassified Nocardia TaxID=2637762 RepID=UPI003692DA1C
MALLQQIIEDAAGDGSVSGILRRLKVAAKRIGAENTLLPWVIRELEGYPPDVEVPDYRQPIPLDPLGYFTDGLYLPVHRDAMPENWRTAPQFEFPRTHPIGEIEVLAADGGVGIWWTTEAVAVFNGRIKREEGGVEPSLNCTKVMAAVGRRPFETVLDAVRNRALDLALELELVAPDVGEVGVPDEVNVAAQQVINIFLAASLAGANNNFGGTDVTQLITAIGDGSGE